MRRAAGGEMSGHLPLKKFTPVYPKYTPFGMVFALSLSLSLSL
jgi:hypothetical protein